MALITYRYVHDVSRESALYSLLVAGIRAVNGLADQIGGGLQAIALALSTPQDNSSDVQKHLDDLQAKLKTSGDALEEAVNRFQSGG